jgi:tRNA1(Val) A37 N6-methylase TrmN6
VNIIKREVDVTEDFFFNGRISILQNRNGYRSSVDSYLLIYFVNKLSNNQICHCIEMGSGSGIIGLGLVSSGIVERVTGIEIQSDLYKLGKENVRRNGFENRIEIANCDIRNREYDFERSDIIVMNPPFWKESEKHKEIASERKIACHEVEGKVIDWIKRGKELLRNRKGRIYLIYPAIKFDKIVMDLNTVGFSPQTICFVHAFRKKNAELVLIESRLGKSENVKILFPIVLKNENGKDTKTLRDIVEGNFNKKIREMPDLRKEIRMHF